MWKIKVDETISGMPRLLMTILWPSFLMAIIAVGVVFSMIDPGTLFILGNEVELNNVVIYSIAFFIFWILGAISSGLTALLMYRT